MLVDLSFLKEVKALFSFHKKIEAHIALSKVSIYQFHYICLYFSTRCTYFSEKPLPLIEYLKNGRKEGLGLGMHSVLLLLPNISVNLSILMLCLFICCNLTKLICFAHSPFIHFTCFISFTSFIDTLLYITNKVVYHANANRIVAICTRM